ncbi:MAG: hypothetical protein KatS3mg106_813 [Gemmataceae bacterium]|nr:MAG: hypothetical protein KatS3mg106_813 [Gemmataceae bacterium]
MPDDNLPSRRAIQRLKRIVEQIGHDLLDCIGVSPGHGERFYGDRRLALMDHRSMGIDHAAGDLLHIDSLPAILDSSRP